MVACMGIGLRVVVKENVRCGWGSFVMFDNVCTSEEGQDAMVGGMLDWCMGGRGHLGA